MEAPEVDVQAPEVDVQAPVAAEAPAADVQEPAAGAIAPLEGGDALVAPATEISGPPLTELVTNLGREQPFKKRQRAAHTLCKSLVHLDAPQVEVLRQLSPVAALLDLAVEAEALNDVLTLQLALSCLANLAVWLQDHGVGSSGILGRLLGRSIHRAHDMSTSESPPLPGEDFLIASPKRRASRAAAASLATYALAVCANLAADREFVAALMQAGPACASELEAMASRKGAYISFDASTAATASSVLRALQHMRASATHAEQKAAKATRKLAKTAAQSAKKVIVVRAAEERRAKKQRRLLEVATLAARRRAEAAIDTEYNQLRVEEALVRSQRAAKTTALETRLSRRLNNVVEVVPPPLVTRGEAKSDEIEARVKKLLMNSAGADEVLAAKQEYISEVDAEQRVAPAAAADGDAPAAVVEEEPLAVVDLLDEAEALDGGAPSQSNSGAATLVIREIVVFDVPNTDAVKEQGLPDPLLIFTLLETHGDAPAPTMRTKDVRNSLNPSWDGPYMLALPAGSSAATDRRPLVRIDMRDYDPENEDDPLCLLETRLTESTGRVERMMLPSVCGQPPSSISFAYEVVSGEVPAQADQAALILRNMQVIDVPDADENGSGSDPYLKFKLLEGPKRKHKPTARTKAQRNTIDPKWDGPLRLVFPDDAPAVTTGEPLVRIMLFDRDKGKDDELCAAEMRLTEKHGHVEKMTLPGVGGFAACTISFDFEIILRGDELPKE